MAADVLDLAGTPLTDAAFRGLVHRGVRELRIDRTGLTDVAMRIISKSDMRLEIMSATHLPITDLGASAVVRSMPLRELDLSYCARLGGEVFSKVRGLRAVALGGLPRVDDDVFADLLANNDLQKLELRDAAVTDRSARALTSTKLAWGRKRRELRLTELTIERCAKITDVFVERLAKCPLVRVTLRDVEVRGLGWLKRVEFLDASRTAVSDLRGLPKTLRALDVSECKITQFIECRDLRSFKANKTTLRDPIALASNPLRELSLSRCPLSDKCAVLLVRRLRRLRRLDLSFSISSRVLREIATLTCLEFLDVSGIVDEAAVQLPRVRELRATDCNLNSAELPCEIVDVSRSRVGTATALKLVEKNLEKITLTGCPIDFEKVRERVTEHPFLSMIEPTVVGRSAENQMALDEWREKMRHRAAIVIGGFFATFFKSPAEEEPEPDDEPAVEGGEDVPPEIPKVQRTLPDVGRPEVRSCEPLEQPTLAPVIPKSFLLLKIFRKWQAYKRELPWAAADALFKRRRRPLFALWKRHAKLAVRRRRRLVAVFLQCVSAESYCGELRVKAELAERHFRRKKLRQHWPLAIVGPNRYVLALAAIRRRRSAALVPRVFEAFCIYRLHRIHQRRRSHIPTGPRFAVRRIHRVAVMRIRERRASEIADEFWSERRLTLAPLSRWRLVRKHLRPAMALAEDHYETSLQLRFERSWPAWLAVKDLARHRFAMRSLWRFRSGLLSARAERVVIAVLLSVATEVAGTIGLTASIVTQREAILASVAAARARVTLSLGERRDFSLEQWERSADECILTQRAALRLQTAYRRARDARLVEEYRAWRDFAVLVLQKNVRRWFAQRQLFKLRRHRVLRETVTAENERLAMESEEEETREFLYLEIMWRRVENLVRRKLAWKRTATLRAEITKHKQRAFLTKRGADIEEMQRREQQRALDEIRETEAALAIQRRFRGAVGRRRFRNKLHVQLDALAAIRCQTAYRAAMGRRKAAAMRRTIAAQQYFRANRRVQGAVLRLLGKKQRKTQRELLRVLVPLGLDPLSFTLSLKAQLRDLRADMLRKPVPPVDCGDPVQHRSGKTAFLVAIDKSIPENPVAELTFDDDGGRSSVPVDALVKFERAAKRKIRIFSAADRAALKIQLLARRRQAMRRVARHRYAFWRDSHAKRRVLLAVLTSFDALQHDAVRVLRRLHGLRLEHFDLPIVPSAFAKVQRDKRLERQIKAELKLRAHLRAKRVRHLRKGARPNNAVKKALFGTQTMTTVRDSEADERDWARFLNAAPPARQMRTRWAPPFLHAHFLFGADAVLALAVRKKLATAATSVRAKPIDISTQFGRSPHLRVREVAFYHGTWPEGEGFLEFLDGYGCEEEKTLRVRIIRAQDLRASDLSTSDPYVRIKCNGRTFRSRTKLRTLNPVYDEVFEVDVSDPKERLVLELWDWDKFSADDYLGSAQIQLGAMDLTAPRRFWIYLGYYPSRGQQTHDRGALEIELQWMEKMSAEDLDLRRMRRRAALRLETWARGRLAVIQRRALERSHRTALNFIFESASTIQTTWRALMSRRFVKKVRVQRRAALRLQALCRRKLAFLDLQELRKRFHAALTIQRIRGARLLAARLRLVRWIEETYAALVIQAFSRSRVRRPRARKGPLDWLAWYGRDFLYGSKRLRRICHRAMRVLLNTGGRVRTVYGHAIVISVNRFITVILLQTTLERTTRAERAERLATAPRHTAVLRPASLLTKVTILEKVVMLQCLFRFTKACRHVFCLFEEHRAARRVQRIARRRLGQKGRAAIKIQTRVRVDLGRKALRELRKEVAAAVKLQLKHRQRLALRRLEDKRLAGCTACLCSSEYFPASLTLESKGFWSSSRPNKQWIVYDMQDPTCIGVCDLICPDNTTAPRFVTIDVSDSATGSFETLLSAELCAPRSLSELRVLEKNAVGHRLQLPLTLRRFWRLSFLRNWGSTECVALSRVRWLVAKEFSPNILRHPDSLFVEGPQVGGWVQFELSIDAFAWPPPEFEWFRDGHPVGKGATLNVKSRVLRSAETKKFRCPHCRKVNRDVPKNVYRTLCMNCQTVFNWPEVTYKEPIDDGEISRLKRQLEREKEDYASLELQLRLQNKPIPDRDLSLEKMIQQKEEEKKRRIFEALKEPRLLEYDCEGVYTCHVSNMRRTIRRTVISEPAAILVGDPPPLKTKVVSDFRPKPHRRRKHFERYVSVHGFFRRGVVSGEVILRYASGDTYCGPIVPEKLLDHMGVSRPGADHWGLWIMPDGTRYEGATVDNHFDTRRIVGDFRVTTTTEVYDGQIVDGKRHGFGECRYPDGSLYSGEWHQGLRQGFGRLEGSSVYEGDWDRDAIHGQGTWHWRDGSSYCGEAVHGIRQGVGVYVSEKHDVFIGEFADNQMHGKGVLSYHDGSRFEGELSMNSRITGVFTDIHGVRYFGTYRDGVRHGEFLVRRPVGDADEIQQGLWENGEFIEWTTLPLNPIATEQFCSVFENEEEYDGVYALMVATRVDSARIAVGKLSPQHAEIFTRCPPIAVVAARGATGPSEGGAYRKKDSPGRWESCGEGYRCERHARKSNVTATLSARKNE
ncbi:hypothetical protein CTAYLR_006686 [Chrysophaeum taylorii]|uniref:C2 domain-containing protein n=1 Tax=Chrysophaeum taylorii TaxID=2483200 RepID=A0AAD7UFM5_9STRA|nr:hypothetical protein CTAYLR_006686 [Chrysophaeum taylorii]